MTFIPPRDFHRHTHAFIFSVPFDIKTSIVIIIIIIIIRLLLSLLVGYCNLL